MDSNQNFLKLPNEVYEKTLQEIVKSELALSPGEYTVECSAGSVKGDNYLGVMYRIVVTSKKNPKVKLNIVAKLPPLNGARREQFSTNFVFERECSFYERVYPMYRQFQEEKGVDVEVDGFRHAPKCYKTLIAEPYEALFFEDLKAKNFEMFDRLKVVTKDQVLLVMKTLAKMHAVSFAIQNQKPELIQDFKEMEDFFLHQCNRRDSGMTMWFDTLKKQGIELLHKSGDLELITRIEAAMENDLEKVLRKCTISEEIEPFAAITHGDCWNNNMMYRYDEDGTPIDIYLLDFQIMRYASPVCDLMYYIFGCTRQSLRREHYQLFIEAYYEELSSFMRRLGSNPEKVYPRDVFDGQLKKFGRFGLAMAMIVLPIFTSDVNDIPDMDDIASKMKEFYDANGEEENFDDSVLKFTSSKTADAYEERMMEVFRDMLELGYV